MVGTMARLALVLALGLGAGPLALSAAEKASTAAIVVTVFRDPGFAFPGVEVILEPKGPPPASSTETAGAKKPKPVKVKKMKGISDSRGELGFRVPAAPMRYTLSIQASGHRLETRDVTVMGEERQDVFVTLVPEKEKPQ